MSFAESVTLADDDGDLSVTDSGLDDNKAILDAINEKHPVIAESTVDEDKKVT